MKDIMKSLRSRSWITSAMSGITGMLFLVTLIWRDWIEAPFGVSPDSGNKSLEWLIVLALFALTVPLFLVTRYEWLVTKFALRSEPTD